MQVSFEPQNEQLYVGPMVSHPYPLHVHEAVEIACVLTGSCVVRIDNKPYELSVGDLAVIFPMMPHSFDALSEDCYGFGVLCPPDAIAEFTQTFRTLLPDDPVIRNATKSSNLHSLIDRLMAMPVGKPAPYRLAYLHLLLAHAFQRMTFHSVDAGTERTLAAQTIQYVYAHACESITLNSAAHALGISRSHLSHLFSSQFRINFRRFINAIRISKAVTQMHDPTVTLTQICYGCGYENMRTFRRAFVKEMGVLPSDYLRQIRSSANGDA